MCVTAIEIINTYADKISTYRKTFGRDISLGLIPETLSLDDVEDVINIMLKTGYTFIAAYVHKCDSTVQFIHIDNIINTMRDTPPSDKKLEQKKLGISLGNVGTISLNDNNIITDGLATYEVLKNNGELFIPYVHKCKTIIHDKYIIRKKLMSKQGNKCYICGKDMLLETNNNNWYRQATIDHVIPLSKGGSNSIGNYAMACTLCNHLKGDKILTPQLKKVIKVESIQLALKYKNALK